jgi:hypothetical protein
VSRATAKAAIKPKNTVLDIGSTPTNPSMASSNTMTAMIQPTLSHAGAPDITTAQTSQTTEKLPKR